MNKINRFSRISAAALALAFVAGLVGCTSTVSKGVDDQGHACETIYPDPEKYAVQVEGSYPVIENLAKLRTGLTKTQVYQLIGMPHYQEGFGAREWDYLLHILNTHSVCRLKLIYSKKMEVGSIHTQPQACLTAAAPK